jgi:hypothetical protein
MTGSVPLEQRVLRCDACGHPFVLSYRRPDISVALATTVVTSQRVNCPRPECGSLQPVLVPVDGHEVTTREALGASELPKSRHSLREILITREVELFASPGTPESRAGAFVPPAAWWRSVAKRLSRWRHADR